MSDQTIKIVAISIFVITYISMLAFSGVRAYIALAAATFFMMLRIISTQSAFSVINWDLIMMLAGIMGLVSLFMDSKMPEVIGSVIISRTKTVRSAILILALFSGLVSAFIDNVATVLILAPIAIDISKKTQISPVKPILAVAFMSNLQGAATLVGDATSILLGNEANLTFLDFFWLQGKLGMFWVVQISSLFALLVIFFFLDKKPKPLFAEEEREKAESIFPSVLLIATVTLLSVSSFLKDDYRPVNLNGCICLALFGFGSVYGELKRGRSGALDGMVYPRKVALPIAERESALSRTLKGIDFFTLLLIGSLFVVVGAIQSAGIIDDIAEFFAELDIGIFGLFTIIVFVSVLLSAFVDNIPYVAAALPVMTGLSGALGIPPYLLYFGLLTGATLGGNITPIGASANITALGILKREGYVVPTTKFMRLSIPFTLVSVLTGYGLVWMIWS